MSCRYHITMLPAAISVIALLIGIAGLEAHADETRATFSFEEHSVEFHNRNVKLAGSLLLPRSEVPVPAVVFVHGAGPQTREPYREAGKYFANQGIAALIYDKRGTGQSGGAYESREPYENLVNDALSAVALLNQRGEIAPSQIGMWGLSQDAYISAAAASRSADIKFVIGAGAFVADGMMFYYRDNLFRKYGLTDKLRDVAEKAQLLQDTLPHILQDELLLSSFLPRSYPPPDKFVHPAWSHVLAKLIPYEELRWYGNGIVQMTLFMLFLFSFLSNTIAGVRHVLARLFHRQQSVALQASDKILNFKRAIFTLNFLILVTFSITAWLVFDQMHPSCPTVLLFLPLLRTVSTLATVALLAVLARTRRDDSWKVARRIRSSLDVLCLVLFCPIHVLLEPDRLSLLMQRNHAQHLPSGAITSVRPPVNC